MGTTLPVLCGMVSTTIFACSMLPMLFKAARTRDLASYSFGNISMANVGNVVHSVYVFHLPPGPIWFLHSFYLLSSALMLCWYLRFARRRRSHCAGQPDSGASPNHPNAAAPRPMSHARVGWAGMASSGRPQNGAF